MLSPISPAVTGRRACGRVTPTAERADRASSPSPDAWRCRGFVHLGNVGADPVFGRLEIAVTASDHVEREASKRDKGSPPLRLEPVRRWRTAMTGPMVVHERFSDRPQDELHSGRL